MHLKNIEVEGKGNFSCPDDWTVDQAEGKIRTGFHLEGGFLMEDGAPLLGNVLISTRTGALSFTRGQGDFNISFSSPLHSNSVSWIAIHRAHVL